MLACLLLLPTAAAANEHLHSSVPCAAAAAAAATAGCFKQAHGRQGVNTEPVQFQPSFLCMHLPTGNRSCELCRKEERREASQRPTNAGMAAQ